MVYRSLSGSTTPNGSAVDLHFVFVRSPRITYDSNGGKPYDCQQTEKADEADPDNVYSFKPIELEAVRKTNKRIVSDQAENKNVNPCKNQLTGGRKLWYFIWDA